MGKRVHRWVNVGGKGQLIGDIIQTRDQPRRRTPQLTRHRSFSLHRVGTRKPRRPDVVASNWRVCYSRYGEFFYACSGDVYEGAFLLDVPQDEPHESCRTSAGATQQFVPTPNKGGPSAYSRHIDRGVRYHKYHISCESIVTSLR